VTIVTAMVGNDCPIGVTISSFTSLSLSPPLILFCLDKNSSSIDDFCRAEHFAVNVLSQSQQDLSNRFASRNREKWAGVSYERWAGGSPILAGCLANFECARAAIHDGGDHRIFVGRVVKLQYASTGNPLVYFRGHYEALAGRTTAIA
jgi:flavin reductase (DIM6/NTAB) family NADH-FMN oxidoreductase RutF